MHHSQNQEQQQRYYEIVFGDPQLFVIKCDMSFQLEKIIINYKTLAFWFL
jgi:hypothetical protein